MQSLEVKSLVRGRVLLPGEKGYDAERAGWNLIVEHHPAMIVVASGPEDVAATVQFAASAGLPVAVQSTGHGPSVPADGAILINTRRMTELAVDPVAGFFRESDESRTGSHRVAEQLFNSPQRTTRV